ncbi:MAG: sigma-70 family RNA polymerase sigma factor [Planctomycetota bacterium]
MSNDWQKISQLHGPMVWQTVYRLLQSHADALDCFQDVMLEAFERSQSNSEPIGNWPGYLRWLSVRRGLDRLRKAKRKGRRFSGDHDVSALSRECPPDSSIELTELKERLRLELTALPERQATAFWLRFIEQLSYEEIATHLDVDARTAGVLIHRAKVRVQKALVDLNPSPAGSRRNT